MTKTTIQDLTRPELEVMKGLWSGGGRMSAREIHDQAGEKNGWAYSTTRTTIERMVKKGLLAKKTFHGIYLYSTDVTRVQGLASLVKDFADRVLEMDYAPVVSLFTQGGKLSAEEIDELSRLLEEDEEGGAS